MLRKKNNKRRWQPKPTALGTDFGIAILVSTCIIGKYDDVQKR